MPSGRRYAHSLPGRPQSAWHPLRVHLDAVAELAAEFAEPFGSGAWGRVAGLWHDLGKLRPEFQQRLRGAAGQVDHAVVGALLAHEKLERERALPLAFAIAGHHGGLPAPSVLKERLRAKRTLLDGLRARVGKDILDAEVPALPAWLGAGRATDRAGQHACRRHLEFWIRWLFSALVDADFLDTEGFFEPEIGRRRAGKPESIDRLEARLTSHVDAICHGAESTPVNQLRRQVLEACQAGASRPRGCFSLSVPTGGGKTLSGMAFALRHAQNQRLRRVLVVIPYTSIIEQNAAVYRRALGEHNVIEHHASLGPAQETERNRLASENWDAPVIVTTSVQFFESLFSNRPSRCRKLHNVAQSVIFLDEVQSLPSGFLLTIVESLNELVAHYGCSVILSTATQPALSARASFGQGLRNVQEIIPSAANLARALHRVEVAWPGEASGPITWQRLAEQLVAHDRVLAVVHRRQDARDLAALLPAQGLFHLSALMCPRHRSDVLERVKQTLHVAGTCRLVSTQLVEAGVDIDFPVVYRALGGLDSVAQAAGRCNREGRLPAGRLIVFRAPTLPPGGTLLKAMRTTESLLRDYGGALSIEDPRLFDRYFRELYFKEDLDAAGIQALRQEFAYPEVARRFQLIEDGFACPVVVPYGDAAHRVEQLRRDGPRRKTLRALQPYVVSVYPGDIERLAEAGAIELVEDAVHVLTLPFAHMYRKNLGLVLDDHRVSDPASLIG